MIVDSGRRTASSNTTPTSDFTERLVDGFFRRWFLYVIPVVLFAGIGVDTAGTITGEFESNAILSATTNPYLEQPDIRGTELGFFETPAAGTARLINEQIQTDAFIDEVATELGLAEAIDAGLITRANIRSRLGASAAGQNNLRLNATWSDPATSLALVESATNAYGEYLTELAVADSQEAVSFWTDRREVASDEADLAQESLNSYVALLPTLAAGGERATEQTLELQRLSSEFDRALDAVREVQSAIDAAQFTANQAASSSARQLVMIDAPVMANNPAPVRRDQATVVAMFTLLGLAIAFGALLLTTLIDRSIRTLSQLALVSGIDVVVAIPRVKQLRRRRRKQPVALDEAA